MVNPRSKKDCGSQEPGAPPIVPQSPLEATCLGTQHGSSDTLLNILLGMLQQQQQQMTSLQQQITSLQQQHQQQSKPSNYLLELKEAHAPTFAGSIDPLEAEKWITEMEKLCQALCIPKDEWVNVTIPFLISDAEAWFISVRLAYESGGRKIDWTQFRDIFFSNYFPTTFRIEKENEFFNLKQGSLTVIQYASMFNQLGRFVFIVHEQSKVTRFKEGLNLNLREYMETHNATTYQGVLEQALRAERLVTEKNQIRDSQRPRPCNEQCEKSESAANKKTTKEKKKGIQEDLDGSTVHGQDDDLVEEDDQWKRCLVGYFSPKFPGIRALQEVVEHFPCHCSLKKHPSSWIIFEFKKEIEVQEVLEAGPYYIYGRTLHLRKRPEFFNFSEEAQSIMSVWIQLPSLPLELWKRPYLNRICTFVGTPRRTDKCTALQERIGFARCLVEVDVSKQLPNFVELVLPNGRRRTQPILYEKLAKFCFSCKRLGHSSDKCSNSVAPTVFIPKKKPVVNIKRDNTTSVHNQSNDRASVDGKSKKADNGKKKVVVVENVSVESEEEPEDYKEWAAGYEVNKKTDTYLAPGASEVKGNDQEVLAKQVGKMVEKVTKQPARSADGKFVKKRG